MTGVDVRVVPAQREGEEALRNLFQLYTYDFSEIMELDVEPNGRFRERPLDCYWEDAWRFPFLFRAADALAGFALVHRKSKLSGADDVWDMAEFFVLRRYRRRGLGMNAALQLFAMHRGEWEVRERSGNIGATAFWRRVIGEFTSNAFREEVLDDERWRGPVQRFSS